MSERYLVLFKEPTKREQWTFRLYDDRADAESYAISYSLPTRIFVVTGEIEPHAPDWDEFIGPMLEAIKREVGA